MENFFAGVVFTFFAIILVVGGMVSHHNSVRNAENHLHEVARQEAIAVLQYQTQYHTLPSE